jgi:hypothetical protein
MVRTGALVHVRHPDTIHWEKLVWGVPEEDRVGDLVKLVELMLREAKTERIVVIVMGTTAATKNGILEGEYTKKFLLDHFDDLWQFKRIKKYLDKLSDKQVAALRKRLEDIVITPIVKNTLQEVQEASRIFRENDIHEVIQITAASHGPRCIQLQATARAEGHMPLDQQWYVTVSDMCFQDTLPNDTMIMEVPHRGDDPLTTFRPTLPQALKPFYYDLDIESKKKIILIIDKFMKEHSKKGAGGY